MEPTVNWTSRRRRRQSVEGDPRFWCWFAALTAAMLLTVASIAVWPEPTLTETPSPLMVVAWWVSVIVVASWLLGTCGLALLVHIIVRHRPHSEEVRQMSFEEFVDLFGD